MRFAAFAVLTLVPLVLGAEEPESLERALPRLPATAAADAVKTFGLANGFRIELVAAEPQVSSPVDLAFDEDGRLWVVEMIDYPYDEREGVPPQGRVRVLDRPEAVTLTRKPQDTVAARVRRDPADLLALALPGVSAGPG